MKSFSLLGSCCSRFIFNYSPFNEVCRVNRYAFQNAIWSCFDDSMDIPWEDIDKIDTAPFTKRMVNYEFNKTTLTELEAVQSDYFMIDLMILRVPVYKIDYKGKTIYTQNISIGTTVLPKMVNMPEFASLSYSKHDITSIPRHIITNAFDKFSVWLLEHYPADKILFYIPQAAHKYILASDQSMHDYSQKDIEKSIILDAVVQDYSDYLISRLGNILTYKYNGEHIAYDKNCQDHVPASYHYTDEIYIENGKELLELLKL